MINGMGKLAEYCEAFYTLSEAEKRCNCENTKCEKADHHVAGDCKKKAGSKKVMYLGSICDECAKGYDPEDFKKEAAEETDEFAGETVFQVVEGVGYSVGEPFSSAGEAIAFAKQMAAKEPDRDFYVDKNTKGSNGRFTSIVLNGGMPIRPNTVVKEAKAEEKGSFCVPASASKDGQPHFPIDTIGRGRNALARVHQYSSVPPWYKGSLKGLQDLVSRKVHSKYPSIGKEKKSSLEEVANGLLMKNAQQAPAAQPAPVPAPAAKPPPVAAKPATPAVAPAKPAVAKPAPAKPAAPKGKLTDQQYQEMIKNITQGLTPQQQQNLKQIETQGTARYSKVAQQTSAEKVHPNKVQTSDAFNDLLPLPANNAPAQKATPPAPVPLPAKGQGVGKFDRKPQSTALPPPPAPAPKDHGKFRSGKFSQLAEALLSKNAQMAAAAPQAQMQALQAKMDAALQPFGYVVAPGSEVRVRPEEKVVDVNVKALPHAKFPSGSQAGELRKILAPLVPGGFAVVPTVSWG